MDGPTGLVELSTADAKLIGENTYDQVGYAVAGAGDVDGDGNDDLLMGAPWEDEGASDAGAAYVVYGPVSGFVDLSQADAKLLGEADNDHTGYTVAGAGDVNDDGFDDLLIGSPDDDTNWPSSGAAYLVHGPVAGTSSLAAADAKLVGVAQCGLAIDGAGDVNGDGHDDLLVATPEDGTQDSDAGATYLVHGPVSGQFDLSGASAMFVGENGGDQSGTSVAGTGDVDGDGLDDFLIGAKRADNVGAAYLVTSTFMGMVDLYYADAKLTGEQGADEAGRAVAGAGDVNADGYADLLVGAPAAPGNTGVGRVYLVLGPVSGTVPLATSDAVFDGEASLDWAGLSLDGAGDVNGDGLDDLFIAAPHNDEGDAGAGAQYLIYGNPTGTLDLANADAKFLGEMLDDESGRSIAGAGDVDGDGYDDLLIGSSYQDAGMTMSGAVYLVLGGP